MRVLTILLLLCGTALAEPMKPEARARLESGLKRFTAKEWDAAIAEFRAGYAIDPRPDFLYAWAQAERLRGNCPEAVKLYQEYIASGVTAAQAKMTADHLARCKDATPPPPPPPVVAPP